jgi:hypothetical protein
VDPELFDLLIEFVGTVDTFPPAGRNALAWLLEGWEKWVEETCPWRLFEVKAAVQEMQERHARREVEHDD